MSNITTMSCLRTSADSEQHRPTLTPHPSYTARLFAADRASLRTRLLADVRGGSREGALVDELE
jgi:NAD(P)H-hydrate repair Nnr-like enzyme with NAD(P)H-hydrate dehydratase domain